MQCEEERLKIKIVFVFDMQCSIMRLGYFSTTVLPTLQCAMNATKFTTDPPYALLHVDSLLSR